MAPGRFQRALSDLVSENFGVDHAAFRRQFGALLMSVSSSWRPSSWDVVVGRQAQILVVLAALVLTLPSATPAVATGTGLIFVSNEKSDEVIVFDSSLKQVKSIPTSRRPRDMHFNHDHTLLYVACGDEDTIDVIDVGKLEVTSSIPAGPSPEMFEIFADGKFFYVSDEEDSRIEKIDIASGQSVQ